MTLRSFRGSLILALLAIALTAPLAFAQEPESDLLVTKTGPEQAAAGSDVTYTVTIFNLGPNASAPITLTDVVPAGMTFVSKGPDPAGFTCFAPSPGSGGTITCSAATLAALASASFTFVFHIAPATPPGTIFVNIATATSPTDPNTENNSGIAATSTPPPPQADMGVAKTGPDKAGPNTDVVYTIMVTNGGLNAASNVTLSDLLPGTMTFVSITQTGTPMSCSTPTPGSGGTVTCTAASYPVGGMTTLTLTGHIPAGTAAGTPFTNTAGVSAATTDPNLENNFASTGLTVSTVGISDISVAKQGPDTVTAGNTISYTLLIANGGPDPAINVQLTDPLPPNTTFVSLVQNTGPPASCSTPAPNGTGTVSCSLALLASGTSAEFTLVLLVGNTISITNIVSGTTASFDTDPTNNTASASTTVIPSADVGIVKSATLDSVTPVKSVTYTIVVTNHGPAAASNVVMTDVLPANATLTSAMTTQGSCAGASTVICTVGTLSPNGSATITLAVTFPSTTGTISNTATVASDTPDPNPGNNFSTATLAAATAIPALSPLAFALLGFALALAAIFVLRARRSSLAP